MKNKDELFRLADRCAPIAASALRLLDDARLLRKAKKYPSASALAVLSMEEVGKLMLHHDAFKEQRGSHVERSTSGSTRNHTKKQAMVTGLLIGNLLITEVEHLINVADSSQVSALATGALTRQDMVRLIGSIDRQLYVNDNSERLKNYRHHGFLIDLAAGYFDRLKQLCFYADHDSNGVWSDASDLINRPMADKSLRLAQVAINSAYRQMKTHEWQLANWRY